MPAVRVVALDEELAALDPAAPWWAWRKQLREIGVLYGTQLVGPPAARLEALVSAVDRWEAAEQRSRWLTAAAPMGVIVGTLGAAAAASQDWGVLAALLGALAVVAAFRHMGAPPPAQGQMAPHPDLARQRAFQALEAARGETFVMADGERVVECSPTRARLSQRRGELTVAVNAERRRLSALSETLQQLAREGEPPADLVASARDAMVRVEATTALLLGVDSALARVETELEALRRRARLEALEARATRLIESGEELARLRAIAEVDLAELDARVRASGGLQVR